MVNAQEWLDKKYPEEERNQIKLIAIDSRDLEGKLKLEGFSNLEMLECFKNKLTNLVLILKYPLKVSSAFSIGLWVKVSVLLLLVNPVHWVLISHKTVWPTSSFLWCLGPSSPSKANTQWYANVSFLLSWFVHPLLK